MSWFEAIPPLACALAMVLLPGLPIAWALGARGITFIALCVGGSVSAIAVSAAIAPVLGVSWQPFTPIIASVPLAALGFVLRRWWAGYFPHAGGDGEWGRSFVAAGFGVLAGALLIALPLASGIGMPNWPAQTPDVSFHFNAVRHMLDTGNASSLAVSLGPHAPASAYPAAWHALVALVAELSGAPIVVAANVTTLAISCLIWPVACVFLARQLFGSARLPLLFAGVFSAAFAAFPLLIAQYGVLYPYLLGVALMPIALGLFVMAVGRAQQAHLEPPGRWLAFCWVLVGVGVSHPSAALGVLALAVPLVAWIVVDRLRCLKERRRLPVQGTVTIVGFLVGIAAFGIIWFKAGEQTGTNFTRPYQSIWQALMEAMTNSPLQRPAAVAVSVFMLLGIIAAARTRRYRWLIASYLVCVGLYMVATGWYPGHLRSALVGIWYNNLPRLAALLPLLAIPLAALGATSAVRWVQRRVRALPRVAASRPSTGRSVMAILAIAAVVIVVPLTQDRSMARAEQVVEDTYRLSASSALLTPDELAIFEVVAKSTPAGAVIAGNPWNGSALVYAYTDREALFPHIRGNWSVDQQKLAQDFAEADEASCDGVRKLGVSYVLGFGDRYLTPANPRVKGYPGFDRLEQSEVVTLVAERGTARLYKVTGCGLR